ncbi:hypothetical protein M011DRAFT_166254 [Sporormia fimetaria CBS 119925]|uniref:Uncharacterized protein n=1 Tax=Sporormia fimetaria CBS 119925 TaxID=1340428 RepID=A0A6A6V378_9PLEO|nr:hypothetical protein M011DRAFT_166254 [Sporormia fimetaria CBS 119925]
MSMWFFEFHLARTPSVCRNQTFGPSASWAADSSNVRVQVLRSCHRAQVLVRPARQPGSYIQYSFLQLILRAIAAAMASRGTSWVCVNHIGQAFLKSCGSWWTTMFAASWVYRSSLNFRGSSLYIKCTFSFERRLSRARASCSARRSAMYWVTIASAVLACVSSIGSLSKSEAIHARARS